MKKVLYVATSDIHLHTFHRPYIEWLLANGYQVDIAVENRGNKNFSGISNMFDIKFPRKFDLRELINSYKQLSLVLSNEQYVLVHCHTPIPSMLVRLAARKSRKKGTKVLYTAHGFHFYKGASMLRWILFYTAEFILSKFTDGIVTINKEDFGYINGKMLHLKSWYIPGIGVNSKRFVPVSSHEKIIIRHEYGFSHHDFLVLYTAEFIPRKNHEFILAAVKKLGDTIPNLKILFAGKGIKQTEIIEMSKNLHVENRVDFLGFRDDIEKICSIVDVGISASKHEGLGLGLVEQMFCKVPVIATIDRGHKELVDNDYNGYLFEQNNVDEFLKYLVLIYEDKVKRCELGINAYKKAHDFEITKSLNAMIVVYKEYLK